MNYLFTDKTGTITENSLSVKEIVDMGNKNIEDILQTISNGSYEKTPMAEVFDIAIKNKLPSGSNNIEFKVRINNVGDWIGIGICLR
jgi:magnesium-transporting ATPase (P-type)